MFCFDSAETEREHSLLRRDPQKPGCNTLPDKRRFVKNSQKSTAHRPAIDNPMSFTPNPLPVPLPRKKIALCRIKMVVEEGKLVASAKPQRGKPPCIGQCMANAFG